MLFRSMIDAEGKSVGVLFDTTPAYLTPKQMHELVDVTRDTFNEKKFHPLLSIGNFLVEFLNIHPFQDGNGRTARLLALLLLYHAGFKVGKYIRLERIIEQSKETYYETLENASKGWYEQTHSVEPWLRYFYGVLIAAYKEFESRVGVFREDTSKTDQIKAFVERAVTPFSITDIEHACPNVSRDMVRLVLRELRDEDKIYSTSKGRGAKWIKK